MRFTEGLAMKLGCFPSGWLSRLLAAVLAIAWCAPCLAQPRLLTAQVESSSQSSRTHGPIAVVWRLRSESTGLLRGSLAATVFDGTDVVMRVTTDELALATGEQSYRMILPAIDSSHGGGGAAYGGVRVVLRFVGPDLKTDLGDFPLRISDQWERTMAVAVCDPWQSQISNELRDFIASLRLETYCSSNKDQSVSVIPCHYRPKDLGTEPLSYCAFNVLLLAREGLAELREDQLDAITDWVNGGGSLCVVPDTAPLQREHLGFLNRLAGADNGLEPLIPDAAGRLSLAGAAPRLAAYGLGRVALLTGTRDKPVDSSEDLRRTVAFLWRMRHDMFGGFVSSGVWELPVVPADANAANQGPWDRNYFKQLRLERNRTLVPSPMQSADQLLERLIPRTMRLLPLPLVGLILAGYVLLIGPVDYFGLGILKQRKWTWALFPLVTVGVTLTTVKLSHWYMGNTDTPKRVVVADLGRDDRIARSSEYRLKVSGTERTFETEVVGGLFNVVDHRRFGSGGWYTHFVNVQQGRDEENRGSDSPMMFGRVPSQYTVRQFLPQWSPKLNRVFGIVRHQAAATAGMSAVEGATAAPAGTTAPASRPETAGGAASLEPLAFDWGQFAGPAGIRAAELGEAETLARLKGALQAVPGLQGAYVATEKKLIAVAGPAMGRVFASDVNVSRQQMYVPGGVVSQSADEFLNNICAHPNDGLFAVVSRLAPHGGGDFEDLPLLDVGDPAQWLLVICVERGDDLIVWRRLYGETGR